jgi:hypothetical protein
MRYFVGANTAIEGACHCAIIPPRCARPEIESITRLGNDAALVNSWATPEARNRSAGPEQSRQVQRIQSQARARWLNISPVNFELAVEPNPLEQQPE